MRLELVVIDWAVRALGVAAVGLLILAGGYALLRGYLVFIDRWRTLWGLFALWYSIAREDRAKLWTAAERWGAWNVGDERRREVEDAEARLHRKYENREAYLRARFEIPADKLVDRDYEGHLLTVVWSDGSPDGCSAKVAFPDAQDVEAVDPQRS